MGPTIKDIAAAAGVSPMTVSNVLGARGGYTEETAQRVRQSTETLGYRPNVSARAMRQGRFGCAALVLSSAGGGRSVLPQGLLRGIAAALDARGMHASIASLSDEQLTGDASLPKLLREWAADGLLLNYNRLIPQRLAKLIEQHSIPCVWINYNRETDAVYPDDFGAGRRATEELIRRGHRRIAFLNDPFSREHAHYSEIDRRNGYGKAMHDAHLKEIAVDHRSGPATSRERIAAWRQLLTGRDPATAVLSHSVASLHVVVRAAEQLRLRIPEDLSLMTFGGSRAWVGQDVATMLVPEAEVGRTAVEMLISKIEAPARRLPSRPIAFGFDAGETLAAVRRPGRADAG